jgi:hypothetical protein
MRREGLGHAVVEQLRPNALRQAERSSTSVFLRRTFDRSSRMRSGGIQESGSRP